MPLATSFLIAFIITYISIPIIVNISRHKKLFDVPNERASHFQEVPVLGGLSIFASFAIASIICSLPVDSGDVKFLLGGIIVLFFLGLKDDVFLIDPWKKFLGQITSASIIVILGDIRITSLHSVIGIDNISYLPSVIISIFLIVSLINGFNLIDGVDGLASGAGILISLFVGIWFVLNQNYTFAVLSFSLAGSLLAYFRFNVFGKVNKIFMGDTGSMITGLIVAVLIIKFLESEISATGKIRFYSSPSIAFGLLIIPLFDTLRIIILRLLKGGSPFKADKNHIHHYFLRLGFSHLKTTLVILSFNLFIVFFVVLFQRLGDVSLILMTLFFVTFFSYLLSYFLRKQENINSR